MMMNLNLLMEFLFLVDMLQWKILEETQILEEFYYTFIKIINQLVLSVMDL